MAEPQMEEVGRVSGFFAHPSVAIVELSKPLKLGDAVYIKGHTTDFQQTVESMQVNHQPVQEARPGDSIGLKVKDRCRQHDAVYKLVG
jgi:putative protease